MLRLRKIVHIFDDSGLTEFTDLAASYGQERFGYVVTPNVDHLIRYYEDPAFRAQYRAAEFILMDSRFAATITFESDTQTVLDCLDGLRSGLAV